MLKEFKIYPELWNDKRYYFVKVRVFNTRSEMLANMKSFNSPSCKDTQGQVSGLAHYNAKGRLTGLIAVMWLNQADLRINPEIIPHESVHAAMRHIINKKVDLSNMDGEEVLAYCVGSMTSQVNNKCYKIGVFE